MSKCGMHQTKHPAKCIKMTMKLSARRRGIARHVGTFYSSLSCRRRPSILSALRARSVGRQFEEKKMLCRRPAAAVSCRIETGMRARQQALCSENIGDAEYSSKFGQRGMNHSAQSSTHFHRAASHVHALREATVLTGIARAGVRNASILLAAHALCDGRHFSASAWLSSHRGFLPLRHEKSCVRPACPLLARRNSMPASWPIGRRRAACVFIRHQRGGQGAYA